MSTSVPAFAVPLCYSFSTFNSSAWYDAPVSRDRCEHTLLTDDPRTITRGRRDTMPKLALHAADSRGLARLGDGGPSKV